MRRRFTLVELLVSVALMVVLTGTITFVFLQAQEIFNRTTSQVEVQQQARWLLDVLERDLQGVERTTQMGFFRDKLLGTKDRYDVGEELPLLGAAPDPFPYHRALTVRQRTEGQGSATLRRDSILLSTSTIVNGDLRRALVEYALEGQGERRRLVRRVWVHPGPAPVSQTPGPYVEDLRFELFAKTRSGEAGDFREARALARQGLLSDRDGATVQACYQGSGRFDAAGLFRPSGALPLLQVGDRLTLQVGSGQVPQLTLREVAPDSVRFVEPIDPAWRGRDLPYLAGWLPAALRIRLRVRDRQGRSARVVSRVVRLGG